MNKSATAQCATAVSLFRGLYGRVARELGVDVSYVSRIAHGERNSKVAERVLAREFCKILALIGNGSLAFNKSRRTRIKNPPKSGYRA
jgi:hypothetical protein